MSKTNHEDKALKNILQGREVEKKIQVAGYDKKFSEEQKEKREQEKKSSKEHSDLMAKVRMPLFCPECQGIMTKRLDKKFWMKGFNKCFECVMEEEHQIRLKGPEAWKKYENEKMKNNADAWLKDEEQGFNEWKDMILNPKDIVHEDGRIEKWDSNSKEGNKQFVKNLEKEFKQMKSDVLKAFKE